MFPWGGNYFFPWPTKTPYSGWMYPPKNVSLGQYMSIAGQHKLNALKRYKPYAMIVGVFYVGGLYFTGKSWYNQYKNGGTFYIDLKNDEGSLMMGPACPKAKAERQRKYIMHAEHM